MDVSRLALVVLVIVLAFAGSACKSSDGAEADESHTNNHEHASPSSSSGGEAGEGATAKHAEGHGRHHGFEDPEKHAEEWNAEERDTWQKPEEVIELMGVDAGDTVVDLGTGTGYFLPHLSRAVGPDGRVLALDVSEKMLEYVDSDMRPELPHDNLETRLVERDDPGLDPESADHILMVNTWHHVKDRVTYAEKLHAGLEPGGSFVDVDYTMETDRGPPKKIRLTPDEVVEELESAGFEAEVLDESLPEQYIVVGTKPDS